MLKSINIQSIINLLTKWLLLVFILYSDLSNSQNDTSPTTTSPSIAAHTGKIERSYLQASKILWISDTTGTYVQGSEKLLEKGLGQALLSQEKFCLLKSDKDNTASILLDFGKELHGGLQIVTGQYPNAQPINVRIRFGESVSEAMAELGNTSNTNATNDHAIRDWKLQLPWLGKIEIGNTGFRFVRIDLLDKDVELYLKEVNAISVKRDIPYLGSFKCNDERLNQIWETGAYTVHLNMQDYLWDGIKRDRLVWVGDMHPEINTINAVFGNQQVVPKSLDFARDNTPATEWMNGISSYSLWWIINHYDWYMAQGDLEYLKKQEIYLSKLTNHLIKYIDEEKGEVLTGTRFLDWPSLGNDKAIHVGLNALFSIAMDKASKIGGFLDNKELEVKAREAQKKLDSHRPQPVDSKQANALIILSKSGSKDQLSKIIKGGTEGISVFYGYYVLEALAENGEIDLALSIINDFWGGMLDLGATTFWEEFELDDIKLRNRIDELPKSNLINYHGETGKHCYIGYRRSLCNGWASGPTPWLSKHGLGIKIIEPGSRKIQIKPNLGTLKWVEGSYPTPLGLIKVRHEKKPSGVIVSNIDAPKGIEIIK